jgi:hypothetical protein
MKTNVIALIVVLGSTALLSGQSPTPSDVPAFHQPFSATYLYRHEMTGVPASGRPILKEKRPVFSSKFLKSLGIDSNLKFQPGDVLVTVASDGSNTMYAWREADHPRDVVVYDKDHTIAYRDSATASYCDPMNLRVLSDAPPPLPFALPSTLPPVTQRLYSDGRDALINPPAAARKVYLLMPLSVTSEPLPYVGGYSLPDSKSGWPKYWVGNLRRPAIKISMTGRRSLGSFDIPQSMDVFQSMTASGGASGKDSAMTIKDSFRLLSAKAGAPPSDAFRVQTYIKDGDTVDDGHIIIRYDASQGSITDQFRAMRAANPEPVKRSAKGSL